MKSEGRPTKEDTFWLWVVPFALLALTATIVTFVWIASENPITTPAPVIPTASAAPGTRGLLAMLLLPLMRMILGRN